MKYDLQQQAEQFKKGHIRKKRWHKVVSVLACITVFATTYALMMPAITMTKETTCGIAEHAHGQECWTETGTLISLDNCTLGLHVHDASCLDAYGNPCCGYADYVIHQHDSFCRDGAGNLICPLAEVYEHQHGLWWCLGAAGRFITICSCSFVVYISSICAIANERKNGTAFPM